MNLIGTKYDATHMRVILTDQYRFIYLIKIRSEQDLKTFQTMDVT